MSRARPSSVLVFGEDDNDREAIGHLLHALREDLPPVRKRRKPLVLIKNREEAQARKNAMSIAKLVSVEHKRSAVRAVFAHEDADAVEDAHVDIADAIEEHLGDRGVDPIVAVVPAFEMETWWFLWPDAVAAVNSKWRRLTRTGQVGKLRDAKEALRRDLRPRKKDGRPPRDYEESDGPRIAEQVRRLGIVGSPKAVSHSWQRFRTAVGALSF